MTPFFRKIRKKLADDNKPAKYLRYAIGEILLVVIGILIALQINNWNTHRKERIREKVFIEQLSADLQLSVDGTKKTKEYFDERAVASGKVVHAFYKPTQQNDFNPRNFFIPWSNQRYIPVMGTAKALVNSGSIDLIRSYKLRNAIVEYIEKIEALLVDVDRYEESYYRRGIESIDDEVQLSNFRAEYFREINFKFPKDRTDLERATFPIPEDFEVIPFPVSVEDMFRNERIFHAYYSLLLAHRNTAGQYKSMMGASNELLELIKGEGYETNFEEVKQVSKEAKDSIAPQQNSND